MKFTRRTAVELMGASALAPFAAAPSAAAQIPAPPKEGKDTPKIAVGMGDFAPGSAESGPKRIKQLGVNSVLGGGPGQLPWTEESLNAAMERWKVAGITVGNL